MRGIILVVTLAIVGCQQIKFEPIFSGRKTYQYKYEGVLMNGVTKKDLVRTGVKIISDVDISEVAQKTYVLQLVNPLILEYNGIWPNTPFVSMDKLIQDLKQQLVQPVKFEYNHGQLGQIFTPAGVSNTVVNIHRGILNMLQMTMKSTQTIYQLFESDIAGTCHTSYVLQQENGSDHIIVTKSKDLTNCKEKVQKFSGMAYLQNPTSHNKLAKIILGTAVYKYTLKPLKNIPGLLIAEVTSKAIYQFSPFNGESEAFLSEASQKFVLAEVKEVHRSFPDLQFQKRGNIQYQFASEIHHIPTLLFRIENVEGEVINLLQQLVVRNVENVHKDSPNQFLELVKLLRTCTYEDIHGVWKQHANSQQYRSWFLDALPAVGNTVTFRFIAERIIKTELTMTEAGQVLVTAMHLVQADLDTLKIAADLISTRSNINSRIVYSLALLAYGSMVNRFCVMNKDCPDIILKPLHDFAATALNTAQEENTILALKALGNAGHPASIKVIMKVLPGLSTVAPDFLAKVQVDAVMALRTIAEQDPTNVQVITLGIFMDQSQQPEVRMLASVVLLEAKPPLALLTTIAEALSHETSLQVTSFVYSFMKSLSQSTAPGHERLAAACDAAVKLLRPNLDQLSYRYSKAIYMNLYKDNMMLGAAANIYLVKSANSIIPRFSIFKFQGYVLGKTAEPLEFGIRAEGIEDALTKNSGESHTVSASDNIKRVLKLLSRWKYLPSGKSLASVYIKLFGQEIFFAHMDKKLIEEIFQVVRGPVSKYTMLWKAVAMLQKGKTLQFSKPFVLAQLRGIIPTCIGLPSEMSLHSTAVVTVSVTAQAKIIPTPLGESSLTQLLSSEVQLSTDGSMGMAVRTSGTVGINTELFQAGRELHVTVHATTPVKVNTKVDVKEKNLKLHFDPCIRHTDLLTMRTEAFAVTRNIEEKGVEKKTQLHPEYPENYNLKSHFKPEALGSEGKDSAASVTLSDEIMSTKTIPTFERRTHVPADQDNMCAEASNFGFKVCLETQSVNSAIRDMPLYQIIRHDFLTISLKPAPNSDAALERVEIEIQTGPKSAAKIIQMTTIVQEPATTLLRDKALPKLRGILTNDKQLKGYERKVRSSSRSESFSSSESSRSSIKPKNLWDLFPPLFAIVTRAKRSDGNLQGYELAVYSDTTSSKRRVQLLAMEIGSMEQWQVCINAEVQNEYKALMLMQWGKECQEYRVTMEGTTGRLATNPALKIKAKWGRIPHVMKHAGQMLAAYLPEAAGILGFSEKFHRNPSKELALYLAASSPRTLDIILKTPAMTVYSLTVPVPIAMPTDNTQRPSGLTLSLSKTLTKLTKSSKSECITEGAKFTTFDGVQFMYDMPQGCFHILAQDCLYSPRFIILIKRSSVSAHLRVLRAHINENEIEILPSVSGKLRLVYNGQEISSWNLPFTNTHGEVVIKAEGRGLALQTEQYGLDRMYFDGERAEVRINSIMEGRMCGMCGHSDGEIKLELRMPDTNVASSATSFAHSWMLMNDSCREDCKLQQEHVGLDRSVSIMGEMARCYSIEPVLSCTPGCTPTHTALLNVSFHCLPVENLIKMDNYGSLAGKKEHLVDSVVAHTECSCPEEHCTN